MSVTFFGESFSSKTFADDVASIFCKAVRDWSSVGEVMDFFSATFGAEGEGLVPEVGLKEAEMARNWFLF